MDKPGMRPPSFDPVSYIIGTMEPRMKAAEKQIAEWREREARLMSAVTTYGKRGAIIALVWTLAVLVNAFPDSTVAHYAEALRLALMQ